MLNGQHFSTGELDTVEDCPFYKYGGNKSNEYYNSNNNNNYLFFALILVK